ncbi:unnamed protein product [Leuciscus chuanchicus]
MEGSEWSVEEGYSYLSYQTVLRPHQIGLTVTAPKAEPVQILFLKGSSVLKSNAFYCVHGGTGSLIPKIPDTNRIRNYIPRCDPPQSDSPGPRRARHGAGKTGDLAPRGSPPNCGGEGPSTPGHTETSDGNGKGRRRSIIHN